MMLYDQIKPTQVVLTRLEHVMKIWHIKISQNTAYTRSKAMLTFEHMKPVFSE